MYIREGDSTFYNGSWFRNVFKVNGSTPQYMAFDNGNGWGKVGSIGDPAPLKPNTRYYWTVAACDGSTCRTASAVSFVTKAVDTTPPTVSLKYYPTVSTIDKTVLGWPSSDNVAVVGHTLVRITQSSVLNINVGILHAYEDTNREAYAYYVVAIDAAGNRTTSNTIQVDRDRDSFIDLTELKIGTSTISKCGANSVPPSFDNNSTVGAADLGLLERQLGGTNRRYDLNVDGKVDAADKAILLTHYGKNFCT